jgi:hypothetical protein
MARVISFDIKKLDILVKLHSKNLIYFDATWDSTSRQCRRVISSALVHKRPGSILFHCDLDGNSDVEDYVTEVCVCERASE